MAAPGPPPSPPAPSVAPTPAPLAKATRERLVTLDFNNVDLPVFVKFVSEITGKNFVIDERVRGKVTIYSPSRIPVDKVYQVFLSVLSLKGLAASPVGEVVQILPANEVPPDRSINVYYLENANAEEMAKLLAGLVTRAAAPGVRAPTAGARGAGEFEGAVQIIPDKPTNALIITASESDYTMLKEVIRKLDVKRRQIYVEAVIIEVGQDRLKELGTQIGVAGGYQTGNQQVTVLGGFNEDPASLVGLTNVPGIDLSPVNVRLLLKALQSVTDANVLSTPQLLATSNQKARIVVGQNVPFPSSSSQTPGGLTQRQITRQDVGVTLEITPEALEGNRVRMDVRQEISTVTETPQQVLIDLGPTTNKREASTSVVVENHQTVVIGGLIRDDLTKVESKVPLLGDIPLLGWFFKFRSWRSVKTNLLIFLTPHVLLDAHEIDQIRQQKSDDLRRAMMTDESNELRDRREGVLNTINAPRNPVPPSSR